MARTLGAGVVMPEGARSSFVAPRILAVRVLDLDAAVLFLDDDLAEIGLLRHTLSLFDRPAPSYCGG